MAVDEEPVPQPRGQRVPPRRRPPTAIGVLTPDPPSRPWLRRVVGRAAAALSEASRVARRR
ncbi:MAG: hypothetical protein AB1505_15575 [Candidatus Latescibacterota bacterium]